MRNLKRALSLALASVMLLGMMVVGTSAASYPDVADENNVEAISVLNAVGAMIGDENGNFNPDKPVTRNEMAAVVARLLLGADAETYPGAVPFTDVPEWAVKYVAACYDNGIVTGRDETTYDGDGTVTAQEAGVMMLRALGYENITDTGADWAKRAVAQAGKISLFKGVTGNVTATLNRNDIAQLSLNTLKATVVETKITGTTGTITSGDVNVSLSGTVEYIDLTTEEYDYKTGDAPDEAETLQLCEKLYGNDLVFADGTDADGEDVTDSFGRPASTWSFENEEIIKVAKAAKKSYVGAVTAKTLYSDLSLRATNAEEAANTVAAANVKVLVDGVEIAVDDEGANANEVPAAIAKDDKDTKFGRDGQTIEAYYTKSSDGAGSDEVRIVIINTYLAIVTDDDVVEDDKDGVEITVYGDGNSAGAGEYFYETSLYQKDDVLLVQVAPDKDGDMQIQAILGEPETVSGSVTRVGKDGDVTIDKVKYPVAAQFSAADGDVVDGKDDTAAVTISSDATYTLYLDRNNNVLAVVEEENSATTTELVYVYDTSTGTVLEGKKVKYTLYATVVRMDGTFEQLPIGDLKDEEFSNADDLDGVKGKLATLTYDEEDDKYTLGDADGYTSLAYPAAPDEDDEDDEGDEGGTSDAVELRADGKYALLDGEDNYYLSKDTVYLFISEKDDKDPPEIDTIERFVGGVDFEIDPGTKGAFAADSKDNADYVVILAPYTSTAKDIVYISNSAAQGTEEAGILFKGYKDGGNKEELLVVKKIGTDDATSESTPSGFYKYSLTDKGGMKLTVLEDDVKTGAVQSVTSGNLIKVGDDTTPYDASGVKVVDLSNTDHKTPTAEDGEEAAEAAADVNDYGRNVTSLSALKTVVEKTTTTGEGEEAVTAATYTVTVDLYVNDDDEVVALFIKSIAKAAAPEDGENDDGNKDMNVTASTQNVAITLSNNTGTGTVTLTFTDPSDGVSVNATTETDGLEASYSDGTVTITASKTVTDGSVTVTITKTGYNDKTITISVTAS